eukprot:scaffold47753_cov58-Attheya_sp.AAC.2
MMKKFNTSKQESNSNSNSNNQQWQKKEAIQMGQEGDSVNLHTELIQKAKGVLDDSLILYTPFVDGIDSKKNI